MTTEIDTTRTSGAFSFSVRGAGDIGRELETQLAANGFEAVDVISMVQMTAPTDKTGYAYHPFVVVVTCDKRVGSRRLHPAVFSAGS
jgi:hypothetical protein